MVELTSQQLEQVRLLSREGNREIVIRQVLGLTPREWRELKALDESPLQDALDRGRADGAGSVIAFMRKAMDEGSMRAAEWLAERVYQIAPAAAADTGAPRIIFNVPVLSAEEFRALTSLPAPTQQRKERDAIDVSR